MNDQPGIKLGGPELVDDLKSLWLVLHAHHQSVLPGFAYQPDEASWAARRREYVRWLADPESFVLIAYEAERPVGYALVEIIDGPEDTWISGERRAELQSLALVPEWRGRGLGALLLDRVDAELEKRGIRDVMLQVLQGNDDAQRFYERRGFRAVMTTMARFDSQ